MRNPARSARAVAAERARREHPEEAGALDAGGFRRARVVVDEHGKRDPILFDERARVADVAGPDHHHLAAERLDLRIPVAQLRGVLPAVQSAEVAREDQDHAALPPEIAQASGRGVRVGERERRESPEVHGGDSRRSGQRRRTRLRSRAARPRFPKARRGCGRRGAAWLRARSRSCRTSRNTDPRRSGGPRPSGCPSPRRSGSAIVRTGRRLSRGLPEP